MGIEKLADPAPRKRFAFSLRFLLAWMLLTSLLSWFSLNHIEHKNRDFEVSKVGGITGIYIVQLQLQGWPYPVYIGHRDAADPDYFNDTPIANTPTVQLYKNRDFLVWGLVTNLALCLVVSFVTCAGIGFGYRRLSKTSTS